MSQKKASKSSGQKTATYWRVRRLPRDINSVVDGVSNPQDALTIGKRALELGSLDHRHHPRQQRTATDAKR